MKNREIYRYIERYCAHNEELDTISNADLAYDILAHELDQESPQKSSP